MNSYIGHYNSEYLRFLDFYVSNVYSNPSNSSKVLATGSNITARDGFIPLDAYQYYRYWIMDLKNNDTSIFRYNNFDNRKINLNVEELSSEEYRINTEYSLELDYASASRIFSHRNLSTAFNQHYGLYEIEIRDKNKYYYYYVYKGIILDHNFNILLMVTKKLPNIINIDTIFKSYVENNRMYLSTELQFNDEHKPLYRKIKNKLIEAVAKLGIQIITQPSLKIKEDVYSDRFINIFDKLVKKESYDIDDFNKFLNNKFRDKMKSSLGIRSVKVDTGLPSLDDIRLELPNLPTPQEFELSDHYRQILNNSGMSSRFQYDQRNQYYRDIQNRLRGNEQEE